MKVKHLLLGVAIVALMAACGNKATETATETAAEETMTEETMTETAPEEVAEPVKEESKTPAPAAKKQATTKQTTAQQQQTTPAVDPCEAKVKAFEKWADELAVAKKNRTQGADALKAYNALKRQYAEMEATVETCKSNPDYQTRLKNAFLREKSAR